MFEKYVTSSAHKTSGSYEGDSRFVRSIYLSSNHGYLTTVLIAKPKQKCCLLLLSEPNQKVTEVF